MLCMIRDQVGKLCELGWGGHVIKCMVDCKVQGLGRSLWLLCPKWCEAWPVPLHLCIFCMSRNASWGCWVKVVR